MQPLLLPKLCCRIICTETFEERVAWFSMPPVFCLFWRQQTLKLTQPTPEDGRPDGKAGKPDTHGKNRWRAGLRGEVRVSTYTDDPLALGDYGNLVSADGRVFEILEIREGKNVVVVRFRGVNDRNAAESLNGLELFIERDNLPDDDLDDDEFYYTDLEGLEAVDAEGKVTAPSVLSMISVPAICWSSKVLAVAPPSFHFLKRPCWRSTSRPDVSLSTRWPPA